MRWSFEHLQLDPARVEALVPIAIAATNKLFELAFTRSTLAEHNIDRHWHNTRTHTLHDPVSWKYAIIGNYALDDINPPSHDWI